MKLTNVLCLIAVVAMSFVTVNCANQNAGAKLRRVHFDFDQSYIRRDMIPVMDGNVAYVKGMKRHFSTNSIVRGGGHRVTVEGHCDERGSNEYNYALGARRAEAVKSYMVTHGVGSSRIKTVSYGEDKPICRRGTESCWYQNRRAEFSTR